MELPKRKSNRLSNYSYSQSGTYFLTICTVEKRPILCRIHQGTSFIPPRIQLSRYGIIAERQILSLPHFYSDVQVNKYVIMPNHIHMLLTIHTESTASDVPANERIPFLISSFKRFTNKAAEANLWQRSYYDHVIRDESDYLTRWNYIENNPAKWILDRFYVPDE